MGFFFTFFYQPIANALFFPLSIIDNSSFVLGTIFLVVLTKIVILPLHIKTKRFQIKMKPITEDLKKIKNKIKDKKLQAEKTLEIYKKAGINPLTPILSLLIQIPIFINAFFIVKDLGENTFIYEEALYSFVGEINLSFQFLFINLLEKGGIIIALLVGATQFLLFYISKDSLGTDQSKKMQIYMFLIGFPLLAAGVSFFFVATIGVYWFINNIVSILQEVLLKKAIK